MLIWKDHSNISDWVPASFDESLQILNDRLEKPSIIVIIIIILVLLVLALLPPLLSGFGSWGVLFIAFRGMEERSVRIDGNASVVLRERWYGMYEVGEIDEVKHNIMVWMAIIGGISYGISGLRFRPAFKVR